MKKKLQGVLRLTLPPKQISSNWRNTFYSIMSIMVLLFSNTINAQTVETFTTPTATSLGAPFAEATTYKIQDYIYAPDTGDASKTYLYRVTGAGTGATTAVNGTGTGTSGTLVDFNARPAGTGAYLSGTVAFTYAGTWANFAPTFAYAANAVINVVDTGNSQLNYSYKVITAGTSGTLVDFNARAAGTGDITSGTVVFQYVSPINPIMAATQSWTCPAGIYSIDVQAYGGGGGGGAIPNSMPLSAKYYASAGGGAGSKVTKTITVVPGTTYNVIVGLGGLRGATSAAAGYYGYPGGKSGFTGSGISDLIASGGTGGTGAGAVNPQGNPGGSLGGVYGYQVFGTATTSYVNGDTGVTLKLGGSTILSTDAVYAKGSAYATGTIKNVSYIASKIQGTGFTVAPTVTVKDGAGQTFASYINKDINSFGEGIVTTRGANGGNGTTATTEVAAVAGAGASNVDGLAGGLAGANLVSATTAKGGGNAPYNSYGAGGGGAFLFSTAGTGNSTSSASGGFGAQGKVVITYAAATATSETVTYCGAYSPAGSGQTYTESGIYTYNVGNNTVTLTLTVNPAPTEPTKVNCYDTYTLSQETCTWVNNNVVGPNAGTDGLTTVCAGNTPTTQQLNDAITGEEEGGAWTNVGLVYTYTVTATCGATDTATVTVTEQALPNAGTDTTLTVCTGTTPSESDLSAALTGEDAGGTWTNDGLVHTYTVNATAPCTGSDTATVTVTIQAAPNAGTDTTLSLFAAPSNADLLAALTGADANGTWSHPAVGFVGVHTYTVIATAPCTGIDTSTVTVTSSSVIPSSPYAVCTGVTVATVTAGTTLKFYKDNIPTTAALAAGEKLKAQIYYVTDTAAGLITDPRTAVTVTLTALVPAPAVSSLESKNICKYIGSSMPVTFTSTSTASPAPSSYSWSVPAGAQIVGSTTSSSIQVSFFGATVVTPGLIGEVSVDSRNELGCPSGKPKLLALTTKAPKAPKSVVLTFNAVVIKKGGNFVGDASKILTLTATDDSGTASKYVWSLPPGTIVVDGNANTDKVITVHLGNVAAANTDLEFSCASFAGCASSTKTLIVKRSEAGTPKAITLTDALLPLVTKITKLDAYTGELKTRTLTLTATENTKAGSEATSYRWVLPAAATIVNNTATAVVDQANTYTSNSNVISINLASVGTEIAFTFKVFGVNGNGASLASKDLGCTSALPKAPAGIFSGATGSGTAFATYNPGCGTVTISVPAVLGVYNTLAVVSATSGNTVGITHTEGSNTATIDLASAGGTLLAKSTITIRATAYTATGSSFKDYVVKFGACSATAKIAPEAITPEKFSAVAYPNPATEGFRVKSSNGKSFGVQVYDMLGRSIEQRQMSSDAQIGSNYAKGIYNVIVNQGANVKTLRVIKN